jgi:sugar fermentation stimulation protein A
MDCDRFCIAGDIDPAYAAALSRAMAAGVEALCVDTEISTEAITVRRALQLDLD